MNTAGMRDRIAEALVAAGVAGRPYPPDIASPGVAWPVRRTTTPMAGGIQITWDVFLVLSTAVPVPAVDELADRVADHLSDVAVITGWDPVTIPVDPAGTAEVPAYRFQITTVH